MSFINNMHYRELKKGFESNQLFAHIHAYDLYRDWLEAVWLFCDAVNNLQAFRMRLDKYTFVQGQEIGRLFNVYCQAVEDLPYQDILGTLFMELDINSVRAGQYFTPFPIAEMMAHSLFSKEDFERCVEEKGVVTVCDPAVGSGVMLLAFAKVVQDSLGREGVNKLRLYGSDIDIRCVHMCRIQLRMNGLDAFGRMAILLGNMPSQVGQVIPFPDKPEQLIAVGQTDFQF